MYFVKLVCALTSYILFSNCDVSETTFFSRLHAEHLVSEQLRGSRVGGVVSGDNARNCVRKQQQHLQVNDKRILNIKNVGEIKL